MKEVPNLTYILKLSKGNSQFEKTLLDILGSENLNLDEVSFAGNKMLLWNSELGDG